MIPLHRHQLARLNTAGWNSVLSQVQTDELQRCVELWAEQALPLVVTRQSCETQPRALSLGLVTPERWGRQRLLFTVAREGIGWFDEFPAAAKLGAQLLPSQRAAWLQLSAAVQGTGAMVRVFGSRGWQLLTGLSYVRPSSDIDLWITVRDAAHADTVVHALLEHSDGSLPRIDGELCFPQGRAVAWREWSAWRAGDTRQILVKGLHQIELRAQDSGWADDVERAAA